MRQNKKAIEPLIATVLLIVIVLAAAAVVWTVVIPLIKNTTSQATACMNTIGLTIDKEWTCWDKKTRGGTEEFNFTQFKVVRDSKEFELVDVIVKLNYGDGSAVTKKLKADLAQPLPVNVLEEKVYPVFYSGENPSWGIADTDKVLSISIAPVVKIGNTEKICDITSTVEIDPCSLAA